MIIFAKIRISIDYKDFITQNVQPAPDCISYHHQSEATAPVGRIHLDCYLLVFGYLLDMVHCLQISADSFLVHAIFEGQLT